jgi:hypothetical protein
LPGTEVAGVDAAGVEVAVLPDVAVCDGVPLVPGAADGVTGPHAVTSAATPVTVAAPIARRVVRLDEVMSGVLPWAAPLAV